MIQVEEVQQMEVPMLQLSGTEKASQKMQTRWRKVSEKRKSNGNRDWHWVVWKKGKLEEILYTKDQIIPYMYAWFEQNSKSMINKIQDKSKVKLINICYMRAFGISRAKYTETSGVMSLNW